MGSKFAALLGASFLTAPAVQAGVNIALPDIGTFSGYTAPAGPSYTGNGFIGMYSGGTSAHLFTIEAQSARTIAQVDISQFAGQTINSAGVSFSMLDGQNYPAPAYALTGFGGDGTLEYQWNAPILNFGVANGVAGVGANSIDITQILVNALGAGENWLNLHFAATDATGYRWTYTSSAAVPGRTADSAQVRLTVDAVPLVNAVPEPSTWAMLILGFGAVGGALRRRASAASSSRVQLTYA